MVPFNLLPAEMRLRAFIVGGWAACPALAGDLDVFVLCAKGAAISAIALDTERRDIITHLATSSFEYECEDTMIYEHAFNIRKVARVTTGAYPNIHLCLANTSNIQAVLAGFDVSTHQVAIDCYGHVIRGKDWTPVHVPPRALLNTSNTPERMARIAARFGHPAPESPLF